MHCIDKESVALWILVHIKVSSKKKKFKIYFKTKTLWTVPLSLFLSLSLEGYQWQSKVGGGWFSLRKQVERQDRPPSTTGNSETDGRQRSDCGAETIVGQSQLSENLFTSQESVGWIVRKQVERRRGEGRARVTLGNDWLSTVCYKVTHLNMQYPGALNNIASSTWIWERDTMPPHPVPIFCWISFKVSCLKPGFV